MSLDLPGKDVGCHHTGFEKKCRALVTDGVCNRWVHIIGTNPNTGDPVSKYDCVDNWGPLLMIENSQQQRCTAASVDKAANEIAGVKHAISERLTNRLIEPITNSTTRLLT